MRMVCTFVFTLAVLSSYSECSSHPARNYHSERDPGPSSPFARQQHSPDQSPPEEPPVRARSKSPASTTTPVEILGCSIRELGYIRLIPNTDDRIQFEFRRYYFPVGKPIRLRAETHRRVPVPTQEHIVLSLSNGDVFAILDYSGFLRPIFRADRYHPRVKINMISGEVKDLTPEEIQSCQTGKNHPISPRNFRKIYANDDSLQFIWNHHSELQESPVRRYRPKYYPSRPSSDQIFGSALEQLGYVRLIPCRNHNQTFEFRRYVFPVNERIRMRIENLVYSFKLNQEYIVLSTSNGEVFAILDNDDNLRGIYNTDEHHCRVKINMMNGQVIVMTQSECRDVPIGKNQPISSESFNRAFSNYDSLQTQWNFYSAGNQSSPFLVRQHSRDQTSASEPSLLVRSRSPPGRPPFHQVLGHSLDTLGYIRLIPQANRDRRFEFRRYVITADKPIRLLKTNGLYVLVPDREHIVLSTSDGEVFAILEYTGILRGIYGTNNNHSRVKINMMSGTVVYMTAMEISECHVGSRYPIFPRWFHQDLSNEDSLQRMYY